MFFILYAGREVPPNGLQLVLTLRCLTAPAYSMKYVKGDFILVPNKSVLTELSATAQTLFLWLCGYADDDGICFPSRATLANNLSCSSRTVDVYIKELVDKGVIKKVNRVSGNEKQSNLYQILIVEKEGGRANSALPRAKNNTTPRANSAHRTITNRTITTQQAEQGSAEEFRIVKDDDEKPIKPKKFDPTVVFVLFKKKYPLNWKTNVTERQAAENLYKERGIDQIEKALSFAGEYCHHPFCPKIHKPSDLDRKWAQLLAFKKKEYGDWWFN